jgi:glycosyltransferase involved in cell wall biosynthesis
MKDNVILSVCIPTYNRSQRVFATVSKILSYQSKEIEVVVVDNDSTDDTFNRLKSITDDRLVIHKNETNIGGPRNLIQSLLISKGNYKVLLSDEDELYLESIIDLIKSNDLHSPFYIEGKEHIIDSLINESSKLISPSFINYLKYSESTNYMTGMVFSNLGTEELNSILELIGDYVYPQNIIKNLKISQGNAIFTNLHFFKRGEYDKYYNSSDKNGDFYFSPRGRLQLYKEEILHHNLIYKFSRIKSIIILLRSFFKLSKLIIGFRSLIVELDEYHMVNFPELCHRRFSIDSDYVQNMKDGRDCYLEFIGSDLKFLVPRLALYTIIQIYINFNKVKLRLV